MRQLLLSWLAGLVVASFSTVEAQPAFLRKDVLLAPYPETVIPADLNGDERLDLVVALLDGWVTAINDGQGNFVQMTRHSSGLYGAVTADFNGDGRSDLVTGISTALLLSNGDGTFASAGIVSSGDALLASDFNDGKADLVVTTNGAGAQVLLGNGDGTFQPGVLLTSERVTHADAEDFNGDREIDIAAFVPGDEWDEGFVLVFLGGGDGTFGAEVRTSIKPWGYEDVPLTRRSWSPISTATSCPTLPSATESCSGRETAAFARDPRIPLMWKGCIRLAPRTLTETVSQILPLATHL